MLITIGETNAAELYGRIFSDVEYIKLRSGAEINSPSSAVIIKSGKAAIKNASGVITEENAVFEFPRGVQLIVCGNGSKNTVSITSRTSDRITLALNRAIKTKSGICEPLELPVEMLNGFSEFDYMAAFAAMLIGK